MINYIRFLSETFYSHNGFKSEQIETDKYDEYISSYDIIGFEIKNKINIYFSKIILHFNIREIF